MTKAIAFLEKVVYSKGCKALHTKHVGFAKQDQAKYIKTIEKGIKEYLFENFFWKCKFFKRKQ